MNTKLIIVVFFLLLVSPPAWAALTFTGESKTYLQAREAINGDDVMPLYEYLDFRFQDTRSKNLSFHFAGWARTNLEGEILGEKTNSELQYAYVSYRKNTNNALANAGRVYVFEGVASEQIDGLYVRTDVGGGFEVAAFGGIPLETDEDGGSGDSIYGGRIAQGRPGRYQVGISYLNEEDDSDEFREEQGIDLWWRLRPKADLRGRSWYNAITSNWMQHNYYLVLGPFDKLKVNAEASKVYYEDYFQSATMSAFQFTTLDPNEIITIVGTGVEYPFNSALTGIVDYKNYDYELAGEADYFGGMLAYAVRDYSAGLSLYRMDGETDRLKYGEYRAYAQKQWARTDATVDLLVVSYDEEINGVKNVYTAVAAVGYAFNAQARALADLEYGRNPEFDKEVRAMVRFVYRFDVSSR